MTTNIAILPVLDDAIASATNTKHTRSANQLEDAKRSLLRHPPSTSGIVKHAIGALEGVLTQTYKNRSSMDDVLRDHSLKGTSRKMLRGLWSYANDQARHILETKDEPSYDDAIFRLHSACAIIMRLGAVCIVSVAMCHHWMPQSPTTSVPSVVVQHTVATTATGRQRNTEVALRCASIPTTSLYIGNLMAVSVIGSGVSCV